MKFAELLKSHTLASVVAYDNKYCKLQCEYGFRWGSDSQHLHTRFLVRRWPIIAQYMDHVTKTIQSTSSGIFPQILPSIQFHISTDCPMKYWRKLWQALRSSSFSQPSQVCQTYNKFKNVSVCFRNITRRIAWILPSNITVWVWFSMGTWFQHLHTRFLVRCWPLMPGAHATNWQKLPPNLTANHRNPLPFLFITSLILSQDVTSLIVVISTSAWCLTVIKDTHCMSITQSLLCDSR